MVSDDLPWPELGNVSRGATRGNQGQKGVLSPPDREGRCLLQLRVQPGVLTVLMNKKSSDWYRTLDNEVNQALKLTKTHWRKARRRQDYDAQADQEHMELHEWLQQLKDKVMSHLELLMQRGDIKGPPYIMPNDIELTFLRKFIERQQAGIPHNPRLREAFLQGYLTTPRQPPPVASASRSTSDEPPTHGSDSGWGDEDVSAPPRDAPRYALPPVAAISSPPIVSKIGRGTSLEEDLNSSIHHLQAARSTHRRAQKATADAFARYTAAIEAERGAAHQVSLEEDRRDGLVSALLRQGAQASMHRSAESFQPRRYSYSSDGDLTRFSQWNTNGVRTHTIEHAAPVQSTYRWESDERSNHPPSRPTSQTGSPRDSNGSAPAVAAATAEKDERSPGSRKHMRVWDNEDVGQEPPRKRSNHGSLAGSPALPSTLPTQTHAPN